MIGLAIDMRLAQTKGGRYFAFECAESPCHLKYFMCTGPHTHAEPDGEFMIGLAIDMRLAQTKGGRYFAFECAESPCHLKYFMCTGPHTHGARIDPLLPCGPAGRPRNGGGRRDVHSISD